MDSSRIPKDHIPCFTIQQLSFANIWVTMIKLQPIARIISYHVIHFSQLFLSFIIVGAWNNLQSSHSIRPHIDQRYHSLDTMKSFFLSWILINMQILNIRIPVSFGIFVPPWAPTNECIKTCYQGIIIPYFPEYTLDLRSSSQIPRGLGMTSTIGYKESHGSTSWPVFIHPC